MIVQKKHFAKALALLIIVFVMTTIVMSNRMQANAATKSIKSIATFTCTGDYVNIRTGPGTSYSSTGYYLMRGDTGLVQKWNSSYTWAFVVPSSTTKPSGWVYYQYLQLSPP